MIEFNGKKYSEVRVGGLGLDVNINSIPVATDAVNDVNLTLKDQDGNDVAFTQVGDALEVVIPTADEWQRPSDWLPIPSIATGEQVFYGLCMVHQDRANLVSLRFTGNYTVDWGDGVVENFASNVVAHHQYSWSSVGNVTSEGFEQALIKVTPQAGQNLTGINLQFKHPSMGGGSLKSSIFIDMVMNLPQLAIGASIVLGGTVSIRHAFVERLNIMSIGSATSLVLLCYAFFKLKKFEIGDTSNVTNMQNMFYDCIALQTVPLFNTASVTNMQSMFYDCTSLASVPLFNTASVTNMQSMFQLCYTLTTVPLFNTASVTNMLSMFYNCFALQTVPLFNTASVQNMGNMFQGCPLLKSVTLNLSSVSILSNPFNGTTNIDTLILNGCRYGFNIASNEMSATALNALFTSLGTAVGSQTITITGNPGASTCDTTIATSKGFTVVI